MQPALRFANGRDEANNASSMLIAGYALLMPA